MPFKTGELARFELFAVLFIGTVYSVYCITDILQFLHVKFDFSSPEPKAHR